MTLFLLIRHAMHDQLDRVLTGRRRGVPINAAGREQVRGLAKRLRPVGITHVQSSPCRRALQTAAPIAWDAALSVETFAALDEVEFGDWSGRSFDELYRESGWRQWNEDRARSQAPGGEDMASVQGRIVAHLHRMHAQHPFGRIVIVSHAETIRAAALHLMSMPLDDWSSVPVPPASITRVQVLGPGRALIGLEEPAAA